MIHIDIPDGSSSWDAARDSIAAAMLRPNNNRRKCECFLLIKNRDTKLYETYNRNFFKGVAAGVILHNAIAKLNLREGFKLSDSKSSFYDLFGFSLKTVDNDVWKTFRGVSPLWASYVSLERRYRKCALPFTAETMVEFFEVAEFFKGEGQKHRSPRSREAHLLRRDDEYVLSDAIVKALTYSHGAEKYTFEFVK